MRISHVVVDFSFKIFQFCTENDDYNHPLFNTPSLFNVFKTLTRVESALLHESLMKLCRPCAVHH